jgi:ribokinase
MPRILVLGSSNTDMTVHLPGLPRPGATVLGGSLLSGPGGKGANQAVAAARAGGKVVFITAVGDDDFGRASLDLYKREGIDVSHARTFHGEASGVALIFVDRRGENMIGVASGANARIGPHEIAVLPNALFEPGGLFLVGGLEVPIDAVEAAVLRAHAAGMRVVLNPAPISEVHQSSTVLHHIDVITPNRTELEQLVDVNAADEAGLGEAVLALSAMGPRSVIVTLGSDGALAYHNGEFRKIPSHAVYAVDTVGAGDAFTGALAVALAENRPLFEGAAWATAAAALAVMHHGAQSALPRRAEIDRLAGQHS